MTWIQPNQNMVSPSPVSLPAPAVPATAPAAGKPETGSGDAGWDSFLEKARGIRKADLLPSVPEGGTSERLGDEQSAPLEQATLLVAEPLEPGVKQAVDELQAYLQRVTGKRVARVVWKPGQTQTWPTGQPAGTVFAIGEKGKAGGLMPAASGKGEGYGLRASTLEVAGQAHTVVAVNGDDLLGTQYGVYRLMELTGKRFLTYQDVTEPAKGQARAPLAGYSETYSPQATMSVRGFAPHLYHPLPLTIAFNEPSPEHLETMKRYIDWCVANGQNYVKFELLNPDGKNKYLPWTLNHDKFEAWLPYASQILDYAHERGLKVSANVAFANYVSRNAYAINPIRAIWDNFWLNRREKQALSAAAKLREAEAKLSAVVASKQDPTSAQREVNEAREKAQKAQATYQKRLDAVASRNDKDIQGMLDRLMKAPWDEVSFCLGTSEFSSTNDDLTIHWMNDAAAYLKAKYPQTRALVISHVPQHPWSEKYDTPYFNLTDKADPAVARMIHTTHPYAMTDRAPVYGNENFEHKLKQIYESTAERVDIFEPETSYWVTSDVAVPLFLPVFMLNRKHDLEAIKGVQNLDGQVDFTTAWEWGYWLNDYAVARMQRDPDVSLSAILDGAFQPMGEGRQPMVALMRDVMLAQQHFLIDENLIRHLQGADALTDFGAMAKDLPVVNKLLKGANNMPVRLKPDEIMKYDAKQLEAFEKGELAELDKMATAFEGFADRARAIAPKTAESGKPYQDEIADGLRVNACRARQQQASLAAAVCARKAQLTGDPRWLQKGKAYLAQVKLSMDQGLQMIHDREQDYHDGPEDTYQKGPAPTMWPDRYLTRAHEGTFWKKTFDETRKLFD